VVLLGQQPLGDPHSYVVQFDPEASAMPTLLLGQQP
jgi:hypothetical protein